MPTPTRTILIVLLLAAAGLAAHAKPAMAMGMDDDGTDLDDGYYQHGEWHPPEDNDENRDGRRLFKKKNRQSPGMVPQD